MMNKYMPSRGGRHLKIYYGQNANEYKRIDIAFIHKIIINCPVNFEMYYNKFAASLDNVLKYIVYCVILLLIHQNN